MDGLNTRNKVKRKGSAGERFSKQVTSNENEDSFRVSQGDASKRGRRSDPSTLSTSPLNPGDPQVPGNVDACVNLKNDVQKQHFCDPREMSVVPCNSVPSRPCVMPVLPIQNLQDSNSSLSVVLNGTANKGGTGPAVGAVDIGIGKSAYYFRVALPGVKKDPGEFSCEVECNGKVRVRGVTTTGATAVSRFSRVYEMRVQQQCPPGPFTISFSLPGPVDPRLFSPNFRSDGIFEGVVLKNE